MYVYMYVLFVYNLVEALGGYRDIRYGAAKNNVIES